MKQGHYAQVGAKIGAIVDEKNAAYGDSFHRSGEILRILFPHGVRPDQFEDMLGMVRVIDKMFRIANKKTAFGEDPWQDIAGYAILKCRDIDLGEEDENRKCAM
jgi:hypothetical protein